MLGIIKCCSVEKKNSLIIYSPSCYWQRYDFLSSMEHKQRYFEKCLCGFCSYNGNQWAL